MARKQMNHKILNTNIEVSNFLYIWIGNSKLNAGLFEIEVGNLLLEKKSPLFQK